MIEEKKLYIFDKGIILPSITMFKSRILNMAMQLIITALIYQLSTDDAGFFYYLHLAFNNRDDNRLINNSNICDINTLLQ